MKNGEYNDWSKQAAVKMAIYKAGELKYVYYSYQFEDQKYHRNCEVIAQRMWNRLSRRYSIERDTSIIAFDNQSGFPNRIIRKWDYTDTYDYWRRQVRQNWKPRKSERHP